MLIVFTQLIKAWHLLFSVYMRVDMFTVKRTHLRMVY
jgi:hypothetical protein